MLRSERPLSQREGAWLKAPLQDLLYNFCGLFFLALLGSVIVTNVGSLGIKNALVPLVPFSRASALISVGKISKEARVVNDKIEIRHIMHLGVTFDHRYFDGSQAAHMIKDFEDSLAATMQIQSNPN